MNHMSIMELKSTAGGSNSKPLQSEPESQQPNNSNGFRVTIEILPITAFVFLTYNFCIATYRSRNKPWDLSFLISCYVELVMFFCCLKKHENLPADASTELRDRVKGAVWVLSTLLTCTFIWRISQIMPCYLNVIMWSMSASVIAVGFYFFFLFKGEDPQLWSKYSKLDSELAPEGKV
jgi:Family of unknown function (DUF6490)